MKKMGDKRLEDALRSKKCEGGGDEVDARDVGGEWDRVHCRDCTTDDAAASAALCSPICREDCFRCVVSALSVCNKILHRRPGTTTEVPRKKRPPAACHVCLRPRFLHIHHAGPHRQVRSRLCAEVQASIVPVEEMNE